MTLARHAVVLADLHESPSFRAARFDEGPAFAGRVAVLPSAFNPPTRAHVGLLELAADVPGISHVAALLTTNNVDKSLFGAPLSHRVGMLLALRAPRPEVAVLGSNAARLIDQGLALETAFPGVAFDFVVGYDTLVRIFDEKYYEDMPGALDVFFARHRVIASNRAQATAGALADFLRQPEVAEYAGRVIVRELDTHHAGLSSTGARQSVARGEEPPALTPEVHDYIRRHRLYGEDSDRG